MRQFKEYEKQKIEVLTEYSIPFTLIEPTETGLKKSIMDATAPVRLYLKNQDIHDYQNQKQGPEHKHTTKAYLVTKNSLINTTASFYRPETKQGDPRIWFSKLREYATPNDILSIINISNTLYVINITQLDIITLIKDGSANPLKEIVNSIYISENLVANELLQKLKKIAKKGLLQASITADTAIGRLLEEELGLYINSSKKPDYKGIELKSYRDKRKNRKNLFAQVPNWELSKFKSSEEILNNFGYTRGDDFKLYCTVSAITRNTQGLLLNINNIMNHLIENSDKLRIGDFAVWTLEKLHERLLEKHNETFWIAAASKIINGIEHFHYTNVEHTRKPIISQFDILIQQGIITLDHLIKRNNRGKVFEKGPLFKIKPNALELLFPPSRIYNLLE